eukprot:scaffold82339_cov54-Phaeocystis_antarctica.AAC.1
MSGGGGAREPRGRWPVAVAWRQAPEDCSRDYLFVAILPFLRTFSVRWEGRCITTQRRSGISAAAPCAPKGGSALQKPCQIFTPGTCYAQLRREQANPLLQPPGARAARTAGAAPAAPRAAAVKGCRREARERCTGFKRPPLDTVPVMPPPQQEKSLPQGLIKHHEGCHRGHHYIPPMALSPGYHRFGCSQCRNPFHRLSRAAASAPSH